MKQRDKKLAVIRILIQEMEPMSLPQLLEKLQWQYKERTVRRWLNDMEKEGFIEKTGKKRSTKYQITHTNGAQGGETSSCFSSESLEAIEFVRRPLYERQPTPYIVDLLEDYEPNSTYYLHLDMRDQLQSAGYRSSNEDPAGTYAHKIYHRLLIDLSYNSSRLEGNTYSLLDTERLILSGKSAEGKMDAEKVMILNHKEAIRHLVENASKIEIKPQTIYTLHYLLADGLVESQYSGKIRDHWVRISGSTYIPFEDPTRLQTQLEKITLKAAQIHDPYEQSFFLLAHLSYLQAFTDVNKRTARLTANIPLIIQNLVPLSFNDVEVDDYMSAMIALYELQDLSPLSDLFVFSYLRTCAAYSATVKAMGFDEIRVRYRMERRAIVREVILQKLVGSSMLHWITSQSEKTIPQQVRQAFIEDVLEDLEQMDDSRISGLGITPDQVLSWRLAYDSGEPR